jgi:hypothetical protein
VRQLFVAISLNSFQKGLHKALQFLDKSHFFSVHLQNDFIVMHFSFSLFLFLRVVGIPLCYLILFGLKGFFLHRFKINDSLWGDVSTSNSSEVSFSKFIQLNDLVCLQPLHWMVRICFVLAHIAIPRVCELLELLPLNILHMSQLLVLVLLHAANLPFKL